ncbi:MAG: hypothetical protein IT513_02635 [Burkholderiales bacterium]|nr:hypothetical protein [Burkholderiales bacterium]
MDIKIGQELEFIQDVNVDGRTIARGTRVRVGHIHSEIMAPKLDLVLLNTGKIETIVVDHHVAGLHCRIVSEGA